MTQQLLSTITTFYKENVQNVFPDSNCILFYIFNLTWNDVFDLYVQKNMRVWLVDFNPFGLMTEPLLFDWEELREWNSPQTEFRIVTSQTGIRPSVSIASRLPYELQDLSILSIQNKMNENRDYHKQ